MSTFETIMQRIDAAAAALRRLTGETLLAASKTQLAALREMPKHGLTSPQLADLSLKALRMGLHDDCLPEAMLLFQPLAMDNTSARRSMQSYDTLLDYLTVGDWAKLTNPTLCQQAKEQVLMRRAQ